CRKSSASRRRSWARCGSSMPRLRAQRLLVGYSVGYSPRTRRRCGEVLYWPPRTRQPPRVSLGPFEDLAGDLAPGDRRVLDADWSACELRRVGGPRDPLFDECYRRLWQEFGERGEMERRAVVVERFAWDPRAPVGGHALLYELYAVLRGGVLVGVRDHTAIRTPRGALVVHMSHVLVEPSERGLGLASWLRALPLRTA